MDIQIKKEINASVVTITGRLDAVTAPDYEKQFDALMADGEARFVVDFEQLEYISSAGLRVLLATSKRLKGKGGQICFANISGMVMEVFTISGFGNIFQMHNSVAEALAVIA